MGSIADKLLHLNDCKTSIKAAINDKGVIVDNTVPLSQYAEKISEILSEEIENKVILGEYVEYIYPPFINGEEPTGDKVYVVPAGVTPPAAWTGTIYNDLMVAILSAPENSIIYVLQGEYPLTIFTSLGAKPVYGGFDETGLWENRNPFKYQSMFNANNSPYAFSVYGNNAVDGIGIKNSAMAGFTVGAGVTLKNCIAFSCKTVVTGGNVQTGANGTGGAGFRSETTSFLKNCIAIDCSITGTQGYYTGIAGGGFYQGICNNCIAINCVATRLGAGFANCSCYDCSAIGCNIPLYSPTAQSGIGFGSNNNENILSRCSAIGCFGVGYGSFYGAINMEDCMAIGCYRETYEGLSGGFAGFSSLNAKNCIAINCSLVSTGQLCGAFAVTYPVNCIALNCFVNNYEPSWYEGQDYPYEVSMFQGGSPVNCMAINCKSDYPVYPSSNGSTFWVNSAYNCVALNCKLNGESSSFYAYDEYQQIYNCASEVEPFFGPGGYTTDIRNWLSLTSFPFKSKATAPMNIAGAIDLTINDSTNLAELLGKLQNVIYNNLPDLHIDENSELYQKGYYKAGVTPLTDFDNNVRPYPPSIGAYDVADPDVEYPIGPGPGEEMPQPYFYDMGSENVITPTSFTMVFDATRWEPIEGSSLGFGLFANDMSLGEVLVHVEFIDVSTLIRDGDKYKVTLNAPTMTPIEREQDDDIVLPTTYAVIGNNDSAEVTDYQSLAVLALVSRAGNEDSEADFGYVSYSDV